MLWVWIAVIAAAVIIEAATVQLISIWFALGALVALILNLLNVSQNVQIIVFVAVSLVSLAAFMPLARKMNKKGFVKTNADRCVGIEAVVVEDISNLNATGQVKADGKIWSAKSADGADIASGEIVFVERIEGVKLIVSRQPQSKTESNKYEKLNV